MQWVRNHRRIFLYREWRQNLDNSTAQKILNGEDETYKPHVLAYQEYRKSQSTPQNWKLKISAIELDHPGALQSDYRHFNPILRVELWRQGSTRTFVAAVDGELAVTSAGRITWPGTTLLTTPLLRPSDEFALKIVMTQYIRPSGTYVVGAADVPESILDLSRPIQLRDDAKSPYWTSYPGNSPPRVLMALDSPMLAAEPELPKPPPLPSIETVSFP